MPKERLVGKNKAKLRNLRQYKDMSDAEFDEAFDLLLEERKLEEAEIEESIGEKLAEFEEDYDLSDMKINDKLVLRNLIISILSLEELEQLFASLRQDFNEDSVLMLDRLSSIMSKLRSDISSMQNDLKLTRKIRKDSQEENFFTWLENAKRKAQKFYKDKMLYIFCPNCNRLLANVWLLYTDEDNSITLSCSHCTTVSKIDLAPLYESDNKNLDDVAIP